jgi:RimJ/RimL family protein N-acetyltransferase
VSRTELVTLRPIRSDELHLVWEEREATVPPRRRAEAQRRLRERIERRGELADGRIDLGVDVGGRLVGHVEARQPLGVMPQGVFELGISIFEPDRGLGYGREAIAALTDLLVRDHDAHRVQASTDVHNAAMRAVLERVGFTFEGVMRGFMPTPGGTRADYALYAVTRDDWSARSRVTVTGAEGAEARRSTRT